MRTYLAKVSNNCFGVRLQVYLARRSCPVRNKVSEPSSAACIGDFDVPTDDDLSLGHEAGPTRDQRCLRQLGRKPRRVMGVETLHVRFVFAHITDNSIHP